jgi:hypothetical protein
MAPIPALITVNFISNYAGDHRVCWRTNFSGPYDCSTIVTCIGGGNPCQAQIIIQVDNETCDEVTFDGYVQAVCNDPLSTEGRVPFEATFTPVPLCAPRLISCESSSIFEINITNPGSDYLPLPTPPPVVTILGGGVGATADAVVGDGGIITVADTGGPPSSGYVPGLHVGIPLTTISGSGAGAIVNVSVPGSGIVTAANITVVTPGTGYAINDAVQIAIGDLFSITPWNGAVATVNTGQIIDVILNTSGSGYTVGSGTIAPPLIDGATATIEVILAPCPDQLLGDGCSGNPPVTLTGLEVGQSVQQCMTTDPVAEPGIIISGGAGCCYDCTQTTFSLPEGQPDVILYYTACSTLSVVSQILTGGSSLGPVCAVNGTWWWTDSDVPVSVITSGPCP